MPKRSRAGALTVLSLTGLTLGVTLAVQAAAAPAAPRFLSAADLPPHPSSAWTAGKVTDGVPDELLLCLADALPGYDSRYRDFRTDLDTSARQLTIEVGTKTKAAALAARMNKEIRTCADRLEQGDPDLEATYKDYGKVAVEEGARVHGLHTEHAFGATDIHLLSVGRDDRTVTVVEWSQMGDFADAPVKAFKKTTATAVNKLH